MKVIEKAGNLSYSGNIHILMQFGKEKVDELDKAGFLAEPFRGMQLVFAVLIRRGRNRKAYWIPFSSQVEEYESMAAVVAAREGDKYEERIMRHAFTWQVRATHPDWPCVMEENAWRIWEINYQMK